jgi:hypothetical protein
MLFNLLVRVVPPTTLIHIQDGLSMLSRKFDARLQFVLISYEESKTRHIMPQLPKTH